MAFHVLSSHKLFHLGTATYAAFMVKTFMWEGSQESISFIDREGESATDTSLSKMDQGRNGANSLHFQLVPFSQ